MPPITRLKVGMANAWLIPGEKGYLLVDSGSPGKELRLFNQLKALRVYPEDIKLAIITHVHYDHVGNMAAVQKLCGCPVMVHEAGAHNLGHGVWDLPNGTMAFSKVLMALGRRFPDLTARMTAYQAVIPDIRISSPISLKEWGFAARAIPTPGHTLDSLSVLTDDGHAFVGDTAFNELPKVYGTRLPPFGNDVETMKKSWGVLKENGAKTVYPGHGAAFDAKELV